MDELYMYSPHPKAKLYKRFNDKVELPTANSIVAEIENGTVTRVDFDKFEIELNNYYNRDSFSWVFETETQTEQQEQHGLINEAVYTTIKTNSLKKVSAGDIVNLKCAAWPKGKYFIVTGHPRQDFIYAPDMRPSFQKIELRSLI